MLSAPEQRSMGLCGKVSLYSIVNLAINSLPPTYLIRPIQHRLSRVLVIVLPIVFITPVRLEAASLVNRVLT